MPPIGLLNGTKVVLNELIVYLQLEGTPTEALSERSRVILLYALCSFGNFGSVGIMRTEMVAVAPDRKADLAELGLKALLAGTIATCMTGAVVALIIT